MVDDKNYYMEIEYTGKFTDGTVFDKSEEGEPLKLVTGFGMIIPGLEDELIKLNEGDKKEILVKAKDAYGEISNDIKKVPKADFPQGTELKEGQEFMAQTEIGNLVAKIVKVNDKDVDLTLNHPLAGKDLIFDVKVLVKKEATPEDIKSFLQTE